MPEGGETGAIRKNVRATVFLGVDCRSICRTFGWNGERCLAWHLFVLTWLVGPIRHEKPKCAIVEWWLAEQHNALLSDGQMKQSRRNVGVIGLIISKD